MKKAIVVKPFQDLTEGVFRKVGDTFSVEEERCKYLVSLKLVKEVKEKTRKTVKKG